MALPSDTSECYKDDPEVKTDRASNTSIKKTPVPFQYSTIREAPAMFGFSSPVVPHSPNHTHTSLVLLFVSY